MSGERDLEELLGRIPAPALSRLCDHLRGGGRLKVEFGWTGPGARAEVGNPVGVVMSEQAFRALLEEEEAMEDLDMGWDVEVAIQLALHAFPRFAAAAGITEASEVLSDADGQRVLAIAESARAGVGG